ncbi:uncharacterized protein K441DRAFT_678706 [Cenococcum geophilum 1.58]|uniref:uncharacterized protein n=1 Tax=Cenococcum geophilum 1.58 TaxID=794803 RepID=UPI0035900017|nr:hypothetical protein K441DRAFT_678706 [Cenococcum geophilum 1.58]
MPKAASKSRMEMAEDEIPDHRAQDLSEEQLNQAYSLTHGNFGLMIPDQTYSINRLRALGEQDDHDRACPPFEQPLTSHQDHTHRDLQPATQRQSKAATAATFDLKEPPDVNGYKRAPWALCFPLTSSRIWAPSKNSRKNVIGHD